MAVGFSLQSVFIFVPMMFIYRYLSVFRLVFAERQILYSNMKSQVKLQICPNTFCHLMHVYRQCDMGVSTIPKLRKSLTFFKWAVTQLTKYQWCCRMCWSPKKVSKTECILNSVIWLFFIICLCLHAKI